MADGLRGLLVRIPLEAWMFVLYSKDKRQSLDSQDKEEQIKYREENPGGGEIFRTLPDQP